MSGAADPAAALERFEGRVWSDAVAGAPAAFAAALGLQALPFADGVAIVAPRFPHLLYNRALAFGLERPLEEPDLDRALAVFPSGGPFTVQPSPMARPARIAAWLAARGLESHFEWVIWARDARRAAAPHDPAGVRIERIGPARAEAWTAVACAVFPDEAPLAPWLASLVGREGWSHYLASEEGRAVGIGASFVAGELAWIGWGGTLSERRGRGIQRAMIERRVADAAAQGARWVRAESADDLPARPNPSFRNLARAGFDLAFRRPSHARHAERATG